MSIQTPELYLNALTKLINDDGLYYEYVFQKQTDDQLRTILPFIFNHKHKLNDPSLICYCNLDAIENISFMIKDSDDTLLGLSYHTLREFEGKTYLDYFYFSPTSRAFLRHMNTLGVIIYLEICKNLVKGNIKNYKSIDGLSWILHNKKFNRATHRYWNVSISDENYIPNKKLNITQKELDNIYSIENKLKFNYKISELNSRPFFRMEFVA